MRKRIKQILAGALCFGLAISDKSALSLGEINMDKVTVQAAEYVIISIKRIKTVLLIRDLVF